MIHCEAGKRKENGPCAENSERDKQNGASGSTERIGRSTLHPNSTRTPICMRESNGISKKRNICSYRKGIALDRVPEASLITVQTR